MPLADLICAGAKPLSNCNIVANISWNVNCSWKILSISSLSVTTSPVCWEALLCSIWQLRKTWHSYKSFGITEFHHIPMGYGEILLNPPVYTRHNIPEYGVLQTWNIGWSKSSVMLFLIKKSLSYQILFTVWKNCS